MCYNEAMEPLESITIYDRQKQMFHWIALQDEGERDPTYWQEGNGSCDCNRALKCGEEDVAGVCKGCHRFVITAVNSWPIHFKTWNEDYNY